MNPEEPLLLIVADDLSGAADSAVAFADRAQTAVVLEPGEFPHGAGVVAVDTDSRYLPPAEAAARVTRALAGHGPGTRVYKKVDSTLRGSIGPEVRACLAALHERHGVRRLAVVAPAFPATGRTVVGGRVLVDGEPVDLRHPDRAPLTDQLTAAGLVVDVLPLDALRRGDAHALLAEAYGRADAVVVDAVDDGDLAATLRATGELPVLLVGSGGLAHHLPLPAPVGAAPAVAAPAVAPGPIGPAQGPRPLLICVGSRTEQARAQRRALVERLPATAVTVGAAAGGPEDAGRALRAALLAGRHAVLFPDPDQEVRPSAADRFARALARAAADGLPLAGALVATGGETARAVLLAAGVRSLTVLGEPAPGVVRMRTPAGLAVVTKAGAFGDEDTLLRAARALTGPAAPAPSAADRPSAGAGGALS
ncbi:membrane protein [Streptomyces sulfonofaciens]|uniref:Membrane protein n=1 Tax=Streptomyces sulfonofaciens TaxID=68272 RepID=A0A919L6T8_9ACTN|nr:four-carbon acid sugar kinase family protein [Streptomyces sulfonofaciens]GHH86082.1 membrane protein [Streptomyces sulfonofaciens]